MANRYKIDPRVLLPILGWWSVGQMVNVVAGVFSTSPPWVRAVCAISLLWEIRTRKIIEKDVSKKEK